MLQDLSFSGEPPFLAIADIDHVHLTVQSLVAEEDVQSLSDLSKQSYPFAADPAPFLRRLTKVIQESTLYEQFVIKLDGLVLLIVEVDKTRDQDREWEITLFAPPLPQAAIRLYANGLLLCLYYLLYSSGIDRIIAPAILEERPKQEVLLLTEAGFMPEEEKKEAGKPLVFIFHRPPEIPRHALLPRR